MFAGFWVVFLELNLACNQLSVLARPIDLARAFCLQLYEIILGHMGEFMSTRRLPKNPKKGNRKAGTEIPALSSKLPD